MVILDGYTLNPGDLSWETLQNLVDVVYYDRTSPEDVHHRIHNADMVLTNKAILNESTLRAANNLKYIGVLATGYDIVDTVIAKELGIVVSNVPQYGTQSVAQSAIALLLEVCNQVGHHSKEVFQGRWQRSSDWCFWDYPIIELADKYIGIIGFGRIGQETGKVAKALGMKVLFYDQYAKVSPDVDAEQIHDVSVLLAQSDVVVLHCPLTKDTSEIINSTTLSLMKPNAILINNSRGGLVNDHDLADALQKNTIYAAALDVVSIEPISDSNPLLKCENCFITPHISWASHESRARIMNTSIENAIAFLNGNPVNTVG